MKDGLLLAGTRTTGTELHLGTYYGWIEQIKKAEKQHNVCIFITDYQSLNMDFNGSISETVSELKDVLKEFIPSSIPIIIESKIEEIGTLGLLIAKTFNDGYINRISTFKKHEKEGKKTTLNDLMYPAMMLANVISVGATHIFDKPEYFFQPIDVLNDIIHSTIKKYNRNISKLQTFKKDKINIPSIDGSGPMQRNRKQNGYIKINDIDYGGLDKSFGKIKLPEIEVDPNDRIKRCDVIYKIRESIMRNNSKERCNHTIYPCLECKSEVVKKIYEDIKHIDKDEIKRKRIEEQFIESANERVKKFINQTIFMSG